MPCEEGASTPCAPTRRARVDTDTHAERCRVRMRQRWDLKAISDQQGLGGAWGSRSLRLEGLALQVP